MASCLRLNYCSASVLYYDRRSVGQSVLEKSTHLGLTTRFSLLSDDYGFVDMGRSLSLTRGRLCRLQLLLALASADIFGSDSHGTRDHNLLSQILDFPFPRLLRLAGLRWRSSNPPPHGRLSSLLAANTLVIVSARTVYKTPSLM
jgi:hypothetical protein